MHRITRLARALLFVLLLTLVFPSVPVDAQIQRSQLIRWALIGVGGGIVGGLIFNYVQPDPNGTSSWPGYVDLLPGDMLIGGLIGSAVGLTIPVATYVVKHPGVTPIFDFTKSQPDAVQLSTIFDILVEDLRPSSDSEQLRVYVMDFVGATGTVTSVSSRLSDEARVAIVRSDSLLLLERQLLEVAVQETQFVPYQMANEPERLGDLALFAPADLVVHGKVIYREGTINRLYLRAFSTEDGVVQFAEAFDVDVSDWR